jgi:hypothetical protein
MNYMLAVATTMCVVARFGINSQNKISTRTSRSPDGTTGSQRWDKRKQASLLRAQAVRVVVIL